MDFGNGRSGLGDPAQVGADFVRRPARLAGHSASVRELFVSELGTNGGLAFLQTQKSEAQIPIPPGNYRVTLRELRGGKWDDLWTWWADVPADRYVDVLGDASSNPKNAAAKQELLVTTPNGWWLRCSSDGSGSLGHGPSPDAAADFKAGTIDVSDVLRKLNKPSAADLSKGYRFSVTTRENGELPRSIYSKDADLILGLFKKAPTEDVLVHQGRTFADVWKANPPVLKP